MLGNLREETVRLRRIGERRRSRQIQVRGLRRDCSILSRADGYDSGLKLSFDLLLILTLPIYKVFQRQPFHVTSQVFTEQVDAAVLRHVGSRRYMRREDYALVVP